MNLTHGTGSAWFPTTFDESLWKLLALTLGIEFSDSTACEETPKDITESGAEAPKW